MSNPARETESADATTLKTKGKLGADGEAQHAAEDPFVKAVLKMARPRGEWPADFARNHGHYLFGEPKRD